MCYKLIYIIFIYYIYIYTINLLYTTIYKINAKQEENLFHLFQICDMIKKASNDLSCQR